MRRVTRLLAIAAVASSAQCSGSRDEASRSGTTLNVVEAAATVTPSAKPLAATDLARACRAAIAKLNGRDPKIIKVEAQADGIARVQYRRPDDGKIWKNECRTDGTRIIWRTIDAFGPGGGPGRWRDNPADEVVTFAIKGDRVTITLTYPQEPSEADTESFTLRR